MKIWKVILATLVIFSAGVLAGARLVQMRHGHHSLSGENQPAHQPGSPPSTNNPAHGTNHDGRLSVPMGIRPPGGRMGKEFLERLERDLKLEPEQRKQIEKILEESQKRTREVWKKIEPEMREEMTKTHAEIKAALTPEQGARFEELMKRAPKPPKEGQTNNVPPASEAPPAPQPPNP